MTRWKHTTPLGAKGAKINLTSGKGELVELRLENVACSECDVSGDLRKLLSTACCAL